MVARWQLEANGLSKAEIDDRIASGLLHSVHLGVYAVGHPSILGRGRWMAAVLACGPEAVLSHTSAAALWDLLQAMGSRVHVTAPRSRERRPGIVIHRPRCLHHIDRTVVDGIPITSIPKTLLDIAATRPRLLERAFEAAERLELLDLSAINELLDRSRGRRGRPAVAALAQHLEPASATRSDLERDFLKLCRDAALPRPLVNVIVEGFEVDAVWPDRRLAVELDSRKFHLTRAAFERDRVRDAALQLAGYRVIRITDRRLHHEPDAIVGTVRALLTATKT